MNKAANQKRDHDQWVKGQKRKAKKRLRVAKLQKASRKRQWA